MKTKSFISKLMLLFVVCLGSIALQSCSDDEDNTSTDNSKLVGTWICTYEDGYDTATFNSNGTGTMSEYSEWGEDTWDIIYTYDAESGVLSIREVEDPEDIDEFIVIRLTSNKLVIEDEDGDVWNYTRV